MERNNNILIFYYLIESVTKMLFQSKMFNSFLSLSITINLFCTSDAQPHLLYSKEFEPCGNFFVDPRFGYNNNPKHK